MRLTSTAIWGSDLHLYDVLGMFLTPGDILGHEPMGIVQDVGPEVSHIKPGRPGGHVVQLYDLDSDDRTVMHRASCHVMFTAEPGDVQRMHEADGQPCGVH